MPVTTEPKTPDVDAILRFMRERNPIRSSAAGDGREAVSNRAPGLAPADRIAVTNFLQHRDQTDQAVIEAESNKADFTAPDGSNPTDVLEAQIGRPLHCDEMCKRLQSLNRNFIFERSNAFPEIMGIYLPDETANLSNGRRVRHVCGFESGISPEFTVKHPEAKGPKKITRGWRQVIILLSKKGLINYTAACKAFNVDSGRSSYFWKQERDRLERA